MQADADGLVLGRVEVAGPSPFGGTRDHGLGVGAANRRPVLDGAIEQLVVGHRVGMNVAVRGVPETRLVVQDVHVNAALCRARDRSRGCRAIHRSMSSGGAGTLVKVGGPGLIGVPSGLAPSPASGRLGIVGCAAGRISTMGNADRRRVLRDPTDQSERRAPSSSLAPASPSSHCGEPGACQSCTFSKNQSLPVFQTLFRSQLNRDIGLPPSRLAWDPAAETSPASP